MTKNITIFYCLSKCLKWWKMIKSSNWTLHSDYGTWSLSEFCSCNIGWWVVLVLQSLVGRRVVLILKLKQVHGHLVSQRSKLVVQVLLLRLAVLGVLKDGVVHGREVIQDHELFEVRDKLHQRFSCSHLWPKKHS